MGIGKQFKKAADKAGNAVSDTADKTTSVFNHNMTNYWATDDSRLAKLVKSVYENPPHGGSSVDINYLTNDLKMSPDDAQLVLDYLDRHNNE